MLILPTTTEEGCEVGIDEAGRGCLWGPLFAAAVVLPDKLTTEFASVAEQIKDSKKLTAKRREAIFKKLINSDLVYGIGRVEHDEIDGHGATYANQLAFRRAIDAITVKPSKVKILIDGILTLHKTKEGETCKTEIDGDARFLSIATASILAKESRDAWVKEWCENNKNDSDKYGFTSSKGYGTLKHRTAIKEHGLLEGHRRLYCRKLVPGIIVKRFEKNGYGLVD